jgi:hypothetical protein
MSKTVKIDGVEYAPIAKTPSKEGMKYCIIRTYSAGVFAGYVDEKSKSKDEKRADIYEARNIWYWHGASFLSQLAVDGVNDPNKKSKFPCAVNKIRLTEIITYFECTEKARKSIQEVPVWKK